MKIIIVPNSPVMAARHYCLARSLVAKGHEIHYLMWALPYKVSAAQLIRHLFTSLMPRTYRHEEFTVHQTSRLPYFWPVVNGWLFKYQVKRWYRRLGADIVFTEGYTNEVEMPKGIPYIYDLADDYAAPADVYGSFIYKLAFRLLGIRNVMKRQCKNALAVTAVSDILCDFARQYNSNVVKLPNGVDTQIIQEVLADKMTRPINPHSMIYVTRFGEWSRAIETLQAAVRLKQEFPDLELTLVGEGTESEKMLQFIADHHAEGYIHYKGFIYDRRTLFELMNQSAIGLNISDKNKWRDAAHPIKVIEYSAMGKWAVSTDLKEVEALGFANVVTFSDERADTLLDAMRRALTTPPDKKAFRAISSHVLETYDWDKLTAQLLELVTAAKARSAQPLVLHTTPSYPPSLGGLEKVVQILARQEQQDGLKIAVVTSSLSAVARATAPSDTVPVSYLRTLTVANTRILPGLPLRLLQLQARDTVHVHFASAYIPETVWLMSKLKRFRYVAHMHLDFGPTSWAGFLLKIYKPLVLKYVLRSAAYVVVFTQDQRNEVRRRYGVAPERIRVIPNGVEAAFYAPAPHTPAKKPKLLFVGRLELQKNLPLLLQALEGVSDKFETRIVGGGSLEHELKSLAKKLKLKNVTFAGRLDGEELMTAYRQADIFVLPSEREGMPLVLLEAMAMGLPVVATDVTGTRDVVHGGKNGFLVRYNDVTAFREALLRFVGDPALQTRMSESSRKLARDYSWPKIAKEFESLYETAHQ